jgi:hypothetical protein
MLLFRMFAADDLKACYLQCFHHRRPRERLVVVTHRSNSRFKHTQTTTHTKSKAAASSPGPPLPCSQRRRSPPSRWMPCLRNTRDKADTARTRDGATLAQHVHFDAAADVEQVARCSIGDLRLSTRLSAGVWEKIQHRWLAATHADDILCYRGEPHTQTRRQPHHPNITIDIHPMSSYMGHLRRMIRACNLHEQPQQRCRNKQRPQRT